MKEKIVSEKLPRSILKNMKGRKISDLFGFIKWLDELGRVLIFYNKKEKRTAQCFVFESNLLP